jgi:hypothetical protein
MAVLVEEAEEERRQGTGLLGVQGLHGGPPVLAAAPRRSLERLLLLLFPLSFSPPGALRCGRGMRPRGD